MWPLMRTEDLVGAIWLPNDAKANPTDLTQAQARGARNAGVRILERTKVTGWRVDRGRVTAVSTGRDDIECEYVVNCGGQWAKALADQVGVTVPLYSAEHYHIVTEAIEGLTRTTPTLRDPDGYSYFKEEVRGPLIGGFEPDAKPWVPSAEIPEPFEFQLLPEDWDQFDIIMRSAVHRVPVVEGTGVKKFYNGPESFTPDLGRRAAAARRRAGRLRQLGRLRPQRRPDGAPRLRRAARRRQGRPRLGKPGRVPGRHRRRAPRPDRVVQAAL